MVMILIKMKDIIKGTDVVGSIMSLIWDILNLSHQEDVWKCEYRDHIIKMSLGFFFFFLNFLLIESRIRPLSSSWLQLSSITMIPTAILSAIQPMLQILLPRPMAGLSLLPF